MKNWKNLNDLEKEVIINHSDKILSELKELVINSNLFKNNTDEDSKTYGHHFLGENITIRWYDDINSLEFYITKIKKTENKSFWSTRIVEEKEHVNLCPFKPKKSYRDWNFDDFYDLENYERVKLTEVERTFLNDIFIFLDALVVKVIEFNKKNSTQLDMKKNDILKELDKDNNGEIDLIDNDFNKLLSKYQKQIIGIDKSYIHQFVKVSSYIKTKKSNIQKIFESIEETSSQAELEERLNLLKNQIHTYELLVFHSLNMISALISEDLITFYEIYESFDKIGIYNSNWENEVSDKLTTIGNKLDDLLLSIYEMENRIVSEISYLNYVTQESFNDLNSSVAANLKDINSSIDINNLFTAINTYQLYKINKQTKPLLTK